jgi:hypothetical protein
MTAFNPGASPPPVEMAIRLIFTSGCAMHTSSLNSYDFIPTSYLLSN